MGDEDTILYQCRKCKKSERYRQGSNLSIRDTAIKAGWYLPDEFKTRGLCPSCDGLKACGK